MRNDVQSKQVKISEERGTTMRKRLIAIMVAMMMVIAMPVSVSAISFHDVGEPAGLMKQADTSNYYNGKGFIRLYGSNRYLTAATVAGYVLGYTGWDYYENVIIASGENYPDALGAGYVAYEYGAPIMLTNKAYDAEIADTVANTLLVDNAHTSSSKNFAIVMGGKGAVSVNFTNKLDNNMSASGHENQWWDRWEGADRYATNLATLKKSGVSNEEILICSGTGFADSLSASATGLPIMLVGTSLTTDQINFLKGISSNTYTIIGGTGAVSSTVEKQLTSISGKKPQRLAGKNRYETSYLIAKEFFPNSNAVVLAYGENFPDGLSGCIVSFVHNAPMLLCSTSSMGYVKQYVSEKNVAFGVVLGGPSLISDAAVRNAGITK